MLLVNVRVYVLIQTISIILYPTNNHDDDFDCYFNVQWA